MTQPEHYDTNWLQRRDTIYHYLSLLANEPRSWLFPTEALGAIAPTLTLDQIEDLRGQYETHWRNIGHGTLSIGWAITLRYISTSASHLIADFFDDGEAFLSRTTDYLQTRHFLEAIIELLPAIDHPDFMIRAWQLWCGSQKEQSSSFWLVLPELTRHMLRHNRGDDVIDNFHRILREEKDSGDANLSGWYRAFEQNIDALNDDQIRRILDLTPRPWPLFVGFAGLSTLLALSLRVDSRRQYRLVSDAVVWLQEALYQYDSLVWPVVDIVKHMKTYAPAALAEIHDLRPLMSDVARRVVVRVLLEEQSGIIDASTSPLQRPIRVKHLGEETTEICQLLTAAQDEQELLHEAADRAIAIVQSYRLPGYQIKAIRDLAPLLPPKGIESLLELVSSWPQNHRSNALATLLVPLYRIRGWQIAEECFTNIRDSIDRSRAVSELATVIISGECEYLAQIAEASPRKYYYNRPYWAKGLSFVTARALGVSTDTLTTLHSRHRIG